MTICCYY